MENFKGVDEVFKDNEGENAGRVIGDPANWPGSAEHEVHALGKDAEQDPDAILATELLKKADEERAKGSERQAN